MGTKADLKTRPELVSQFSQLTVQPEVEVQVHYVIPSLENRHFTGREITLGMLQQKLFLEASTDKLAMFGLGGIGKTQVALRLARWVREYVPDCSVFWAPALSVESFEQACSQIVKELQIRPSSDAEAAMETVHRYLSTGHAGRWLFIVDNADDPSLLFDELEEWFPSSKDGVTLLTTRTREVAVSFAGRDIIELEKMTTEEGSSFLTKIVGEDSYALSGQESLTQLLEELNFLPLAISQAAFYICRHNGTVTRYLELMHKTENDWMRLASRDFHDSTRYRKLPNAVTTTWLISYHQIKDSDPYAADLLNFISFLEPKAIPRSILPTTGLDSEEEMDYAIGTLCSYGFLIRSSGEDMFDIHSLVQLSTRAWIAEDQKTQQIITTAVHHLNKCFPPYTSMTHNRETWRMHLPHVMSIIGREESKSLKDRYSLLLRIGKRLVADGRAKEAVTIFEDMYAWNRDTYHEEHPDRLISQHELGRAYYSSGQTQKSIEMLEYVVAVEGRIYQKDDYDLLDSQYLLARAYQADGQIERATELLEYVIDLGKRTLGEEDLDILLFQRKLAELYRMKKRTEEATELLEHVAPIYERQLEEHDSRVLRCQYELALTYDNNGLFEKAMALMEHVVTLREKTLDEVNPHRLYAQHELAQLYYSHGQNERAIELLEYVVSVRTRTLDEESVSLLTSQYELSRAYISGKQPDKAIEVLEHVVAVETRTLDEETSDRLMSRSQLAKAYRLNGQLDKAIEMYEHVVAVRNRILDEENLTRLGSQYDLATSYLSDGQTDKAIELLERGLAVESRILDEDDPICLASCNKLADAYSLNKEYKKAIELRARMLTIYERTLEEEHPTRLAAQHNLALDYLDDTDSEKHIEKAIQLLEHVIMVEATSLDKENLGRLESRRILAEAYEKNGQIEKAIDLVKQVVAAEAEARTLDEEDLGSLRSQRLLEGLLRKKDKSIVDANENISVSPDSDTDTGFALVPVLNS